MTAVNSAILQKLKKLLALAEDRGATEAESATAMRLVHELLTKHNLTLGDVINATDASPVIESVVDDANHARWKHMVWDAASELYFCRCLYSDSNRRKRFRRLYIIGRPDNVETVKHMAPYFIRVIQRLAKDDFACQYFGRKYTKNFLLGAATRLVKRMLALLEEKTKPAAGTGTALVVLYDKVQQELDDFLKGQEVTEVQVKQLDPDAFGFSAGWQKGASINLFLQVAGGSVENRPMVGSGTGR